MPDASGPFKCIEAGDAIAFFLHAPSLTGIDTIGALFSFGTRLLTRRRKRHHRVVPDAELGLLAVLLVAIDPHLAGRPHAKVETITVRQQIFLVARRCRLDQKLVELPHGVPKIDCG